MKPLGNTWTFASIFLALSGMIIVGIRLYFIVLGPAFAARGCALYRPVGCPARNYRAARGRWLAQVFRVLGGYAFAIGVLLVTLAATAFRARNPAAVTGAVAGGASSNGRSPNHELADTISG